MDYYHDHAKKKTERAQKLIKAIESTLADGVRESKSDIWTRLSNSILSSIPKPPKKPRIIKPEKDPAEPALEDPEFKDYFLPVPQKTGEKYKLVLCHT